MGSLIYIRLIGYTTGTLLELFFLILILGYRRRRNFERVLFFLCLALFFFYAGSLLAVNAQIFYARTPAGLHAFAVTVLSTALCFLPPLLVHLHLELAETRGLVRRPLWKRAVLVAFYAPVAYFALLVFPNLVADPGFDFLIPGNAFGRGFGVWLAAAMVVSSRFEWRVGGVTADRPQRGFHAFLAAVFGAGAVLVAYLHILRGPADPSIAGALSTSLALLAILPSALLAYFVLRFNFLEIGRQKNLVYAVSATFLALLYLSLVRRVSVWLEPLLPPEASASILLFLLVVFFEPLQRGVARMLRERLHREVDRLQRLTAEIQQEARQGDFARLARFVEQTVCAEFGLAEVRLELGRSRESSHTPPALEGGEAARAVWPFSSREFPIQQDDRLLGVLHAEPHGATLSGETLAALEFLCEQLPGTLDLCRLIEEKLQLERQLAERERLAVLGQMAASISHNLKNPLGSMKTILQVQLESPELPDSLRDETRLVLKEIERLSAKLNQLLQFSRPAVRGGSVTRSCEARVVVEEVAGVLWHEAERRGIALVVKPADRKISVAANSEAINDIVSNLLVNALEATPCGGHVTVGTEVEDGLCAIVVEDDGPGIPRTLREKILQPFFTTKSQGTGLGLAIVARRVAEFGGEVDWESPVRDGHGTRFHVTLPLEEARKRES